MTRSKTDLFLLYTLDFLSALKKRGQMPRDIMELPLIPLTLFHILRLSCPTGMAIKKLFLYNKSGISKPTVGDTITFTY